MPETIDPYVEQALKTLEASISSLPPEKQATTLDALANFLSVLLTPADFAVERRPHSPLYPTAEQVQTVVNRLRDKAQSQTDKERDDHER